MHLKFLLQSWLETKEPSMTSLIYDQLLKIKRIFVNKFLSFGHFSMKILCLLPRGDLHAVFWGISIVRLIWFGEEILLVNFFFKVIGYELVKLRLIDRFHSHAIKKINRKPFSG